MQRKLLHILRRCGECFLKALELIQTYQLIYVNLQKFILWSDVRKHDRRAHKLKLQHEDMIWSTDMSSSQPCCLFVVLDASACLALKFILKMTLNLRRSHPRCKEDLRYMALFCGGPHIKSNLPKPSQMTKTCPPMRVTVLPPTAHVMILNLALQCWQCLNYFRGISQMQHYHNMIIYLPLLIWAITLILLYLITHTIQTMAHICSVTLNI